MTTKNKRQISAKKTTTELSPQEKAEKEHTLAQEEQREHEKTQVPVSQEEEGGFVEAEMPPGMTEEQFSVFRERAAVMRTAKKEYVSFDKLYRADNVRDTEDVFLEEMVHNFKVADVYMETYPLVVSKKSDGRCLVLQGNRRTEAMEVISESDPALFTRLLAPYNGKVPAVVLEGLSLSQEALIRNDHSKRENRRGLGDKSLFLAVKQLMLTNPGKTQTEIAALLDLTKPDKDDPTKFVPNRELVQQRVNLVRLPKYVQDEFLKVWSRPDYVKDPASGKMVIKTDENGIPTKGKYSSKARVGNINALYKKYREDKKKGFPDGGPEFKKLVDKYIGPPEPGEGSPGSKAPTKKQLEDQKDAVDSKILKDIIDIVLGNLPTDRMVEMDAKLQMMEASYIKLEHVAEALGQKKFRELTKAIDAKIAEAKEAEAKSKAEAKAE